ncbi:hypothetical protein JL100_004340 [Skermanella mucosa]|uniref:hypothetical protein n=1 Tax=Skermanella mucosa TaxID=1789672 RepID=UPI00192C20BB|nr:hypothetical protein [Skermanella mucosa]UEM22001.1 hypothetical protein JL100_004340 [Skermanella mucosa]
MKPEDIIGAWLAGLAIWAAAMLCVVLFGPLPDRAGPLPTPAGITIDDWYAGAWRDEADREWDEADRPSRHDAEPPRLAGEDGTGQPSGTEVSLSPLATPSGQ